MSMGKALLLTPGFRFHPTDVELVLFHLKRKVLGKKFNFEAIAELDIYKHAPWDLPDKSCLPSRDLKWYFFCPRERKYASGARLNRATDFGYWKTTGKDRPVKHNGGGVGMIKTLVYHRGRAPSGDRTDWVMHEYRLEQKALADKGVVQDSYVLCMIFKKDGPGPRNGAQYGAPFREEDWTDNEEENCIEVGNSAKESVPNGLVVERDNAAGGAQVPQTICLGLSSESCVSGAVMPNPQLPKPASGNEVGIINSIVGRPCALRGATGFGCPTQSCVSDAVAPSSKLPQTFSNNDIEMEKLPDHNDSDVPSMLDYFLEDEPFEETENYKNKDTNNVNQDDASTGAACVEADIYKDLGDFDNSASLNAYKATCSLDEIFVSCDDVLFLELMDLEAPLVGAAKDESTQFNRLSAGFNQ